MAWNTLLTSVIAAALVDHCHCALDLSYSDDIDLFKFVTRPEIRAPRLDVNHYDNSQVSDGFIFTSPYAEIYQQRPAPGYYEACQTGPHIYDSNGELVWSGACVFRNKNVADFRSTQTVNGSFVLSGIQLDLDAADKGYYGDGKTRGRGVVFDDTYLEQAAVEAPPNTHSFNMHELKLFNGGQSALHLLWRPEYVDISKLGIADRKAGWVGIMGFREVDLASGGTIFEWWSQDHIPFEESTWPVLGLEGPIPDSWDYFHANSIEKTAEGDYLLSARHTDCIYKISGKDQSILWRLGGKFSTFEIQKFSFGRQHDARTIEPESLGLPREDDVEYITFFNNAADELVAVSVSSTLVLRLDLARMQATLVRQILRPGNGSTLISGNHQLLANGNTFTSWGGNNNHLSEHDSQGHLVSQARFASNRFASYRTYKMDWKGQPSDAELALKCSAWGTSSRRATTVCYVSWNGATEVSHWRFIAAESTTGPHRAMEVATKTGFETKIESDGYSQLVFVEALDAAGALLGKSTHVTVKYPKHWDDTGDL